MGTLKRAIKIDKIDKIDAIDKIFNHQLNNFLFSFSVVKALALQSFAWVKFNIKITIFSCKSRFLLIISIK